MDKDDRGFLDDRFGSNLSLEIVIWELAEYYVILT